jgi:hypothetical protein
MARLLTAKRERPRMSYYTIGEIANHAAVDDFWLLRRNGREIDVYQFAGKSESQASPGGLSANPFTDAAAALNLNIDAIRALTEKTEYGRQLKSDLPEFVRNELRNMPRLGRVVQWRTATEVQEFNGSDGSRHWVILGDTVYDITGSLSARLYGGGRLFF